MGGDERLRVYTDGACSGNPGPGGWAWASSADHFDSGGDPATTNNKMELMAVLRAIEANPGRLQVVSTGAARLPVELQINYVMETV